MEVTYLLSLEEAPRLRIESVEFLDRTNSTHASHSLQTHSFLYLGLSDGSIAQYAIQPSAGSEKAGRTNSSGKVSHLIDALHHATTTQQPSTATTQSNKASSGSSAVFTFRRVRARAMPSCKMRLPVAQLLVCSATTSAPKLIVLCEGILTAAFAESLEMICTTPKEVKEVSTCCLIPGCEDRIAYACRNRVIIAVVSEKRIAPPSSNTGYGTPPHGGGRRGRNLDMTEVFLLPDNVLVVCMTTSLLIVGMKRSYAFLDLSTGQIVDQMPIDRGLPHLALDHYMNTLCLRNHARGIFFKEDESQLTWEERRRVQWPEEPTWAGYHRLSLIATLSQGISVNDVLDETVPALIVPYPSNIGNVRGCVSAECAVFLATQSDVWAVSQIPFQRLLASRVAELRISEAMVLLHRSFQGSEEHRVVLGSHVYECAAYVSFQRGLFHQAFAYFQKASLVTARTILRLFPQLQSSRTSERYPPLPNGTTFERVMEIIAGGGSSFSSITPEGLGFEREKCLERLRTYLTERRQPNERTDEQIDIDFALLRIYLLRCPNMTSEEQRCFADALFLPTNNLIPEEIVPILEGTRHRRLIVLLHITTGAVAEALHQCNELTDCSAEERAHTMVLALQAATDPDLVLRYLKPLFSIDPDIAIHALLVQRPQPLSMDLVLALLCHYPEDLLLAYLEHSVMVDGSTDPYVHNLLARTYIHVITCMAPLRVKRLPMLACGAGLEAGFLGEVRSRLLRFLEESDIYDPLELLGALKATNLHEERIIVYSKCGEYDSVLRIYVEEMQDLAAAEEYCIKRFYGLYRKQRPSATRMLYANRPYGITTTLLTSGEPPSFSTMLFPVTISSGGAPPSINPTPQASDPIRRDETSQGAPPGGGTVSPGNPPDSEESRRTGQRKNALFVGAAQTVMQRRLSEHTEESAAQDKNHLSSSAVPSSPKNANRRSVTILDGGLGSDANSSGSSARRSLSIADVVSNANVSSRSGGGGEGSGSGGATSGSTYSGAGRDAGTTFHGVYRHNEYLCTLIAILLHGEHPREEVALDLLTRHATYLNPLRILTIIPRTMSVAKLSPYLKKVFGQVSHLHRYEHVMSEILASDVLKYRTFLTRLQQRSVHVDDRRTCPVCGKKISNSMIAVFPNMTVVHFRCYKDKHMDPVRNVPFVSDLTRIQ